VTPARRLLLVDIGGVVCRFDGQRRAEALAAASGLDPTEVRSRLFRSGFDTACDRGDFSLDEQCRGICARLGVRASPRQLAEWWAAGFTPDQAVLDVLARARPATRLATLSNNGPLVHLMVQEVYPQVVDAFDELRFSYQVGALKPDPQVFRLTLAALGFHPDEAIFVDDTHEHVESARREGFDGLHFTSAVQLAAELGQRGLG
jgi:putative hydrolase of the HAD superfamily